MVTLIISKGYCFLMNVLGNVNSWLINQFLVMVHFSDVAMSKIVVSKTAGKKTQCRWATELGYTN